MTDPKRLFLQRKKKLTVGDQDIAVFECAVCSHCGRTAVVVTPDDDTLPQAQKQWENAEYYILKENEAEELTDEDGTKEDAKGVGKGENDYVLCPVCARIQVKDFVRRLAGYFESCGSFRTWDAKTEESFADVCVRNAWVAVLNEMFNARRSSSLASMGLLSFEFVKNDDDDILKSVAERYRVDVEDIRQLLNLIVLDAVYSGTLTAKDAQLTPADREYIFFTPVKKILKKIKDAKDAGKSWIIGWAARQRGNGNYYYNAKQERIKRALNISAKDANDFLESYWSAILGNTEDADYSFEATDFNIRLNGDPNLKFYRCKKCGKITAHNCLNHCASVKCSGMLEPYDPAEKLATNHYAKLYQSENMKPLYIKEHTAQLSRDQQTTYQKAFVDKKLNALSCSTTFEMGVDVGSLETVYMRDVPPSPANYVQRAGRAGRSKDSAAFVMTYAKLSSHDFTFYSLENRTNPLLPSKNVPDLIIRMHDRPR